MQRRKKSDPTALNWGSTPHVPSPAHPPCPPRLQNPGGLVHPKSTQHFLASPQQEKQAKASPRLGTSTVPPNTAVTEVVTAEEAAASQAAGPLDQKFLSPTDRYGVLALKEGLPHLQHSLGFNISPHIPGPPAGE